MYTTFAGLINASTGTGLYVPQGVDNFDPNPTYGYFVAVDNATFGKLILRRITNPGGAPTISNNISLTVPATAFPLDVRHKGNRNGREGRLDGVDDRLMCAHIRNNRLWTVHNIGVNNKGVSSNQVKITRNGCRWYEIDVSGLTPILRQAGTLFRETRRNRTTYNSYWMPSIMTNGQGHMALGCSVAGRNRRPDCSTAGRYRNNKLGNIQAGRAITRTGATYNPTADPGSSTRARRWGDYSYTCVDPCDDMTMWTIQEYCDQANSWGVRVCQLLANPPATPINVTPSYVAQGQASVDILIDGKRVKSSEFFDPGAGFNCRLQVSISGGVTVNSVTYLGPKQMRVNISTVGASAGKKNITVTNPDGQSVSVSDLLTIT